MKQRLKKIHIGSVLGLVVAAYIAIYLVQTVYKNYVLQHQISDLRGQINDLQNDKDSLRYKIQYYQTDSYKEKEARAKLGLQAPGEGVVILPHKDDSQPVEQQKPKAPPKSHLQQWVDFLAGKQGGA